MFQESNRRIFKIVKMDRNESCTEPKVDTQEKLTQTVRQVFIMNELNPDNWRQLNIEPIRDTSICIEEQLGKLIYKRVLKKCLALRVANDIQYQHIIEHNGVKALCEITNYILTRELLSAPLDDFDLSKIRSIILVINQRQLRAERVNQNDVEKALFINQQMIPKWKVKSLRVNSKTTVKSLLDSIDSLMKTHVIFDLKLAMEELEEGQPKELVIWAKCITHKSINCKNSAGLYASEYPKISALCE